MYALLVLTLQQSYASKSLDRFQIENTNMYVQLQFWRILGF